MEIILHQHTKNMIENIVSRKPHAILLEGKQGIGLRTIARNIAKSLSSTPLVLADPDGKPLSVQVIRELYRKTSIKKSTIQTVIIDDADTLSISAQNALLKLLEEPTENLIFILLAHHVEKVLPTIRSRVWQVTIPPLTREQTIDLLSMKQIRDETKQRQILYMAPGLPAEINALLGDSEYFETRAAQIRTAREFISQSAYDKLVTIYKLGSDRNQALKLVDDIAQILHLTLKENPKQELVVMLSTFLDVKENLLQDGNVRIQLLKTVL